MFVVSITVAKINHDNYSVATQNIHTMNRSAVQRFLGAQSMLIVLLAITIVAHASPADAKVSKIICV